MTALLHIPDAAVSVRVATLADVPFIDSLQKVHAKQVGWMPTKSLEGKIAAGQVLVAVASGRWSVASEDAAHSPATDHRPPATPLGYCIGTDRYFKRDDVGIIYQLNVAPGKQRGFVGATLLRAMFERAAYGCRLFCCWCAQDIEANRFWEAMGFVPLAYRAGSEKKSRVHIFWQKRIRAGDVETPWWFPSQTTGGSIREDRLVLPIPPGRHWADEMPVLLPGEGPAKLEGPKEKQVRGTKPKAKVPREQVLTTASIGMRFAPPPPAVPETAACPERSRGEKPKPEKKPKRKNDPKLVRAARELRDRWLEHVNTGQVALESDGKYDVSRALPEPSSRPAIPLLPAA